MCMHTARATHVKWAELSSDRSNSQCASAYPPSPTGVSRVGKPSVLQLVGVAVCLFGMWHQLKCHRILYELRGPMNSATNNGATHHIPRCMVARR